MEAYKRQQTFGSSPRPLSRAIPVCSIVPTEIPWYLDGQMDRCLWFMTDDSAWA